MPLSAPQTDEQTDRSGPFDGLKYNHLKLLQINEYGVPPDPTVALKKSGHAENAISPDPPVTRTGVLNYDYFTAFVIRMTKA